MSTDSEENFLAPFDAFLAGLDKHDEGEKLFMLSGLIELLRHTKSATDVFYMAELLAGLPYIDWPRIPFSVTKTLLSRGCHDDVQKLGVPAEHVPAVIRSGFLLFLDEFQADPTATVSFDNLWENIKLVAETSFPPKPAANPKLPAVSPEIFNSGFVRRVFEPVKFTPELAAELRMAVVKYRSSTPAGQRGPEVRGLASWHPDKRFDVLLETGEFLQIAHDDPNLAVSTAPEDFKHLSPAVMLMFVAACDDLVGWGVLDTAQGDKIKAGSLGKIKGMHLCGTSDASDLQPLEHVFDTGREAARMGVTGATGPVGASIRIRVPASDTMVVIEASQDTYGPYSRSWLAQCQTPDHFEHKDVVIMRHEAPRHYSLRGVYLFPLQDRLVSLTIIF